MDPHAEGVQTGVASSRRARAVFLDRDGVINRAIVRDGRPYPPSTLSELELGCGVAEGLAALKAAGFRLIVVTNQPDVARGTQTRQNVAAMHQWLAERLPLDDFRTCYHDDSDDCRCRKPRPGLILNAARDHGIDISSSYLIGDRWRDVEAAYQAGCRSIFIDYGYSERRPGPGCLIVQSFHEACDCILRDSQSNGHQ